MIDAGEALNILLARLDLDSKWVPFIREIFTFVWNELKRLWNQLVNTVLRQEEKPPDKIDIDRIEVCAENIQKIIGFFSTEKVERETFLSQFPEWRVQRQKSIEKLEEIADKIQTSKKVCSTVQIVGGSIGVIGGLAICGAVFFPPAAFVLPVWLGGAAVTALIPTALLPAATGGIAAGVAVGASGATQFITSVTELKIIQDLVEKAEEECKKDGKKFEEMMGWFKRAEEVENALKELFGIDILMEHVFGDLRDFCGMGNESMSSAKLTSALKKTVHHIFNLTQITGCPFNLNSLSLQAAILSALFVVFIVERGNRYLLNCVSCVQKLGLSIAASLEAGVEVGRLVAAGVSKSVELIPRTVGKRVFFGVLAGVGIALDAATIVLNSIDLAEGCKSDEQDKILEVVKQLKEELDSLVKVYVRLRMQGLTSDRAIGPPI